ncbi:MAG TPA: glycosyltransferase [Chitinophaga sp.]|uniref:glycosyltransferase n=1 Tax=Chitinophaga sp. TaxID=1869181 RepID=UPI002D0752D3|nr:glycosyltransferase [Chitinophaga sp.]HVI45455.1 glycosyltransferase [Chitinophaga sp.]
MDTVIMNKGICENPLISVIMGLNQYNSHVDDAINSILRQNFKQFELIIVANACTDELWAWLNKLADSRVRLFRTSIPQLTFNLNYAIDCSKTDLIVRMDADDIAHPDRLKLLYDYMNVHPDVSVCGSGVELIDENGNITGQRNLPLENATIRKQLLIKNPIVHPSVVFRKTAILQLKGYLGGFNSEDYDLWIRALRDEKFRFANLETPLLKYRVHGNSSQGSRLAYAEIPGYFMREFLYTGKFRYLKAFLVSLGKFMLTKKRVV